MAKPDLVIFDFDGTLATLPVDWFGLKQRLLRFLHEQGIEWATITFWKDIEQIKQQLSPGTLEEAYRCIEEYEHPAVPLMEVNEVVVRYLNSVVADGGRVAVCSNNMLSTLRRGLERLGVLQHTSIIIGLDSVQHAKPNPEGIKKIMHTLHVSADNALFVGDTDFDRAAAESAGIGFLHVEQLREGGRTV